MQIRDYLDALAKQTVDEDNCPSQEAAKLHFLDIKKWLEENELLSDEGREIMGLGIDGDFSITSQMLNKQGNEISKKIILVG